MKLAKKQEKFLKDLYVFYRALGGELDAGDFLMDLMKEDKDNDLNWFYAEALIEIDRLEIDRTTLISHKDVLNMGVDGKNLSEGEYYTPLIWAEKGRNIIKETYPDLYGTAYIWDVACGTGNLLVESGYPQDKIIMSTLNQSDVDLVKGLLPEATVFQLDFLNLVDLDKDNNYFSSQLPEKVRKILENNEPLIQETVFLRPGEMGALDRMLQSGDLGFEMRMYNTETDEEVDVLIEERLNTRGEVIYTLDGVPVVVKEESESYKTVRGLLVAVASIVANGGIFGPRVLVNSEVGNGDRYWIPGGLVRLFDLRRASMGVDVAYLYMSWDDKTYRKIG